MTDSREAAIDRVVAEVGLDRVRLQPIGGLSGGRVEALGHFEVHRLADVYVAIKDKPRGFRRSA
jgi:hypothetical protein